MNAIPPRLQSSMRQKTPFFASLLLAVRRLIQISVGFLKRYFFTIVALSSAVLVALIAFLQGQLLYLSQLPYSATIIRLTNKIDQISFLLIIGILSAMIVRMLLMQKSKCSRSVLAGFVTVFLLTLLAKGKFENMGTDSMAEMLHTNTQEASDFARAYLFILNVSLKECIILFAPLLLVPVHWYLNRGMRAEIQLRDMRRALMTIAGVYLITITIFIYQLIANYYSIDYFKNRLDGATSQTLGQLQKTRSAPNIVVYIGETTARESFPSYAGFPAHLDPLNGLKKDLIVYNDVITPFPHTFPSLYRAFTISKNPYLDQFLLVKDISRANSLAALNHAGFDVFWISNQGLGKFWDWNSQLFGMHADHIEVLNSKANSDGKQNRKNDKDLMKAYKRQAHQLAKDNQIVFLHSYAGHADYCKNIPPEEIRSFGHTVPPLPQKAVFGNAYIGNYEKRLNEIECYDSAMAFIAKNIRTVIEDVARQQTPVVFLYFSDHGEEIFEGTGHDSRKNSFRHMEIPFLVYFNQAARKAYPELYRNAIANKDRPYSLEWLSDSLLDLAGISLKDRELVSIFKEGNQTPKRYALRRTDIRGNQYILAIDDEDISKRHELLNHGHDFFQKRRIARSYNGANQEKICSSSTTSLLKYREAARIFDCVEIDITIDAHASQLFAYHPPQKNNHLKLEDMVRFGPPLPKRVILHISNPTNENLEVLRLTLNQLFDPSQRSRIAIEIGDSAVIQSRQPQQLKADGYKIFYALPAETGERCSDDPDNSECSQLKSRLLSTVRQIGIDGIAFDITHFLFLKSLPMPKHLQYKVKDLSVSVRDDIDNEALAHSHFYTIPYKSAFDY